MKALYRTLIITFILSIVLGILFFTVYMQAIFSLFGGWENMVNEVQPPNIAPEDVINHLFSPSIIFSGMGAFFAGLTNIIVGIILVARNAKMDTGEKVLWILGFIFISFITNIIFFALKNSRDLLNDKQQRNMDFDFAGPQ